MEIIKAIFFGIVEGITEWLPISSTGHMILLDEFIHLGVSEEFYKLFEVVIQLGAILAVVLMYFKTIFPWGFGKTKEDTKNTLNLWGKILVACIPAAIIGILFDDWLDEHLYNIDTECQNQFEFLMKQFTKKENITEELKANNQMEWVQKMNSIKNSVNEIIINTYIYN